MSFHRKIIKLILKFYQSTYVFPSESAYLKSNQFWLIVDMIFIGPWTCLVQMTFVDYQTILSSGWHNFQFTPNPVASNKPKNSVVLMFIVPLLLHQMLQKAMKTLTPLLFMIDSDKMSTLCNMFCINNATLWFESCKIMQNKNVQDDILMSQPAFCRVFT